MPRPVTEPVTEALLVFVGVTLGIAALFQLSRFVPFVAEYLQVLVAALFLWLPAWLARRSGGELADFGFSLTGLGRSLRVGLLPLAAIFPLFLVGFVLYYQLVYAQDAGPLAALRLPGRRFLGWDALSWERLAHVVDLGLLESAFAQVVVVAIPEELFFRGYLQARFEQAWPAARRFAGGGVGRALVCSSLLFAISHVAVDLDPRRLAVFFPALLFGWMRSATGSIVAGVAAHAAANLYIDMLHRTFFR